MLEKHTVFNRHKSGQQCSPGRLLAARGRGKSEGTTPIRFKQKLGNCQCFFQAEPGRERPVVRSQLQGSDLDKISFAAGIRPEQREIRGGK